MTTTNLGDRLNLIISEAKADLFAQGELAQLTYRAFVIAAVNIRESKEDNIEVDIPVGFKPDRKPILSKKIYTKNELLGQYELLAVHTLSANVLVRLVAITEALLGDIVRAVVMKHPQKLGGKRTVAIQTVLEATSIEEIHIRATDALLNELFYKSPKAICAA